MHNQNLNPSITRNWYTKLACFVGIAGVTTLISFPVLAKFFPRYALFQPSASNNYPDRGSQNDIATTLTHNSKFANLAKELKEAGLLDTLKQPANFTLFAPTDEAFNALPKDVFTRYSDPKNRIRVLKYHLVSRAVLEKDVDSGAIATVEGNPVRITADSEGEVKLNDASGKYPSTATKNGVIIEIDKVLLPPGF
ncbi:MAG: fasciclin domain-containing protein [Stigonema ocellatum SAG 48.90 = DSM 106950]|nr:fasciclin domain-containing protein [Stigonema ocellatum SAG 48.90 = DSM 106950]